MSEATVSEGMSDYDVAGKSVRKPCELGFLPFFDDPFVVLVEDGTPYVPLSEYNRRINAHHAMLDEKNAELVAAHAKRDFAVQLMLRCYERGDLRCSPDEEREILVLSARLGYREDNP